MINRTLLSFGHGYSAAELAEQLLPQGWIIYGTTRSAQTARRMSAAGVRPILWGEDIRPALREASHILTSVSPNAAGDPVLQTYGPLIAKAAPRLAWAGYLSTTGVYGDHQGGWVDEDTPLTPATDRGQQRVEAEAAWSAIPDLPLHIFRLAGIYGPGRGPFEKIRNGTARRIIKAGQVFSRIHVADIAQVVAASMVQPAQATPRVYNLCDDDPAPPQDVLAHAADLLGLPRPPEVDFEAADLSPMARSFYSESKRVSNARIKSELGITLLYPDYRRGLKAMLDGNT